MPAPTARQHWAEDSWASHPLYSREDWKQEAQQGNTQRGYWDWVEAMIEQDADQTRIQSDVPDSLAIQS
jgi:hypothetical protein